MEQYRMGSWTAVLQVRLIMKGHSFIRENVPRVLSSVKEKSSE